MLENTMGEKNMFHYKPGNDLCLNDEDIAEILLSGAYCHIDLCDVKTNVINLLYNETNVLKEVDINKLPLWAYVMTRKDNGLLLVELATCPKSSIIRYVTPVIDVGLFGDNEYVWWIEKGDTYGLTE